MPTPNGGLITETNEQYYAGAQGFVVSNALGQTVFTFTFNTDLILGSSDPTNINYGKNNFKLYSSADGITYTEYITAYTVDRNVITLGVALPQNNVLVCQLKTIDGGNFGARDAYGTTVEQNYGSYSYLTLQDVVNNFIVGFVGENKLIPNAKRTDIMFHAKRGLQEFSYDTLKVIKSQELTIPPSLSLAIPQDYVNYVSICYIDGFGVKRPLYPNNNLTTNPYNTFLQDSAGQPTQDSHGENTEGTSITEERWDANGIGVINNQLQDGSPVWANVYGGGFGQGFAWQSGFYGIQPEVSQINGCFTINERENTFSFSNDLVDRIIILEYISDGLAYDLDTRVPKMAEEAMYRSISYYLLSTRAGVQEYVVQRYRKDKSAALRNAKIRLSNIKLDEIVQVMRGKSKWIKH